ncbi:hypothetical protein Bca52824_062364 [Brassica carinata]|uniref:Nucleoporin autopeptidase n=1 Tax=Brassica carinata TaxID=52824 RepID=A0A8X7U779_BRACI|nr:hypothetical protein Bca52824_062364 [Brassica carinata]
MFGSSNPFGQSSGTSPFGSQSQSMFGQTSNSSSASSPFGSTPTFGASSSPAFGNPTPAFEHLQHLHLSIGSSAFGQKPLGFSTPQSNPFGSTTQQSQPAFGNSTFGSSTPFGARAHPPVHQALPWGYKHSVWCIKHACLWCHKHACLWLKPTFLWRHKHTCIWSFTDSSFGGTVWLLPSFWPVHISFGSSAFGSTPSPFEPKASTPTFGSSGFGQSPFGGQQQGGSRAVPYAPTVEADTASGTPAGKLESISAMPAYKDKSHEELRWEDYQRGDKGGPRPAGQSPGNTGFGVSAAQPNPFAPSPAFGQTPANLTNPFSSSTSTNPFAPQTPTIASSGFGAATSTFVGQSSAPAFGQTNIFNKPSTGFGNLFSSSSSLTTSSSSPFGQTMAAGMTLSNHLSQVKRQMALVSTTGQTQAANATGNAGGLGFLVKATGQAYGLLQSSVVLQPVTVTNPFGTLPAMPQISINQSGTSPSIQYGISSMPVVDKPVPVRISSLLTSRHLLQRRARLPARKYRPGDNGPKACFYLVPFFADDEENSSSTPKADALFIPRENPRALVIRPVQQWSSRVKPTIPKDRPTAPLHENAFIQILENFTTKMTPEIATDAANHDKNDNREHGSAEERTHPFVNGNHKSNGSTSTDHAGEKDLPYRTLGGHRAGEAAVVHEHSADIEALMPKLRQSDYFTEPRIQELAAKERADPGYCRRVRDFVVGRQGYGSIKFMGVTDVRRLDLESLVQFNNREVIVYLDESKKPAVGEGLNKPAEVTLLNIKCVDKKTGKQFTEGERVEKYKMMLKRKAEAQGAEFVSFDPVKGEWKFRVEHFSSYKLDDEDDDEA